MEVWVEDLQVEIIKGAIFGRKLFQKVIFFHVYCKICGKKRLLSSLIETRDQLQIQREGLKFLNIDRILDKEVLTL